MAFIGIHAQKISVHVPQTVSSGETFRLEYTINSVNLNANIKLGNMPEELDVVYGPSISDNKATAWSTDIPAAHRLRRIHIC